MMFEFEYVDEEPVEAVARKRPNKKIRKQMKYLKKLEFYKMKKEQKKEEKKEKDEEQPLVKKKHKMKRLERANINEKLRRVHENDLCKENLQVSIDCSFSSMMSQKEQSRLAQQIGRCYASNRAADIPARITLTNIDKESFFYKEMNRVNDGFEKYVLIKTDKAIEEYHANNLENLCYLSPDSETALESVDLNKIYVIGGIVDETVTKNVTLNKSNNLKLTCFRLPIQEHMSRRGGDNEEEEKKYNFNKILALNQVFDILLNFNVTKDWKTALSLGVPQRKGFFIEK